MLILALALQSATCTTIGNITRCVDEPAAVTRPIPQPTPVITATPSPEGAKDRRAAAYAQVGQLIADSRCADARKLAAFYGQPDIIADTAKACR